MANKIKKIVLPSAALLTSLYASAPFTFGLIAGYLGTNAFQKKFIQTGKVKLLMIPYKNWKIHIHHWISGSLLIIIAYAIDVIHSPIYFGALGGIVIHDLYTDKEWYKILIKN
ncbi:MAG TPA: hypothetical protein ENL27_01055 [Candidatus Parcubacteria bacterium]|nr:hypothetical protein [Candidatus Parcubacteria bacterium]